MRLLTPKFLLQLIKSLDHFFLNQVLPFGYDWFAANHDLPHGRARQGKHDARKQIVLRGAGDRRIIQIDCEKVGCHSRFESAARRAKAAGAVYRGAIEQASSDGGNPTVRKGAISLARVRIMHETGCTLPDGWVSAIEHS